ncbi:zinc finger protein weckle-like [Anastrepha obliqua]|uniref:zinc finger protein weckle-like n=1 Tax=Anastrepha obliqua TaxID=95512 RepID=UPI002409C3B6|nr:zinc finger protein weckle-like [Anastrepha obliqua]
MQALNNPVDYGGYNSSSTSKDWHYWCRLCAKIDTHSKNIFYEHQRLITSAGGNSDDKRSTLAVAIGKYFYVQVKHDDDLPQLLCTECTSLVSNIADFNERVAKVQEMYTALQSGHYSKDTDFQSIRLKYGILKEDPAQLYTHQYEEDCFTENTDEAVMENLNKFEIILKRENPRDGNQSDEDERDDNEDPFASDFGVETAENKPFCAIKECDGESNDSKYPPEVPSKEQQRKLKTRINISTKEGLKEQDKSGKRLIRTEKEPKDDKYYCSDCSLHFQRRGNFRVHMKKRHGMALEPLTCSQCSKSFKNIFDLNLHIKTHRPLSEKRIFPCPQCDRKFSQKCYVANHIKFVHEDIRPFICEECGEGTRTETTLREHMLIHTDLAPFECEICKKFFKKQSRLKSHMQIHSSSKHICRECGLQLNTRETLNRHMLVHSDIMRHKCDYCGRAFKRAKTLKSHLILHSGLKPYTCDFCDKTFANGANCRTHKRKTHPEELAALEASGEKTYTKNIPKLAVLKTVTKSAENLIPVVSKQSGNFSLGRKPKPPLDYTVDRKQSNSLTGVDASAETVLSGSQTFFKENSLDMTSLTERNNIPSSFWSVQNG